MSFIKIRRLDIKTPSYLQVFFIALGTAAIIFVPFMIIDQGYFFLYGDFNVQQVPFYQLAHKAVRSGEIFWNWNTDLGVNFIGSYTFYLLGSPFFWLTLLFPNSFVPYLMGPLLILKFACAATTAYAYLKRFLKTPEFAVIGGLLYAFSGFSLFNIFFNHFHEPMIFFPLLLVALEEAIVNDRKWVFAWAVFANITVNYFFFVGEVIFCIIYFFLRLLSGAWDLSVKKFFRLAGEAVLGVCMSAALTLPAILVTLSNPRTDSSIYGWNALIYWDKYRPIQILCSFLFPPDLPARPNFTPDSNAKWASIAAWLPMFGMTGVIAFWQNGNRKNWVRRMILILFVMAFVPILNQVFYLFNESYYARWYYMLTIILILATMLALEDASTDWGRAIGWSAGITAAVAIPIAFLKSTPADEETGTEAAYGLMRYPERFWIYVALAMLSILLIAILIVYRRKNRRAATAFMLAGVLLISVLYSAYFIALGKALSYDPVNFIIPYAIESDDIDLPDMDDQNYRIDVYKSMDNMAMFWGLPSINAFHSIVPNSVMEFYPEVNVERGVGTRPETEVYGLRSFLGVRWLFDEVGDDTQFGSKEDPDSALMPGYQYYDRQNGFDIWENMYYVPYGFTFNSYITMEEFEATPKAQRHQMLLKGIVLTPEQEEKYKGILPRIAKEEMEFSYAAMSPDEGTDSYASYKEDCMELKDETCENFKRSSKGFSADITLKKSNLVFFAVPWEEGWTAYVNGEPAEIEKVDIGFMAVLCEKGENAIEFRYMTPGLKEGVFVASTAFAVLIVFSAWGVVPRILKKRKIAKQSGKLVS